MNIICTNDEHIDEEGIVGSCAHEFQASEEELEIENQDKSGTHTTQFLYTGEVECPVCKHSISVKYICDKLDDTGEILSESVNCA